MQKLIVMNGPKEGKKIDRKVNRVGAKMSLFSRCPQTHDRATGFFYIFLLFANVLMSNGP